MAVQGGLRNSRPGWSSSSTGTPGASAGPETRDLVFVDAGPAPHTLHIGSPFLRGQSPLLRGSARLRGPALPWPDGGLLNQGDETCPSSLSVLSLRAVLPAVEYKHAIGGHATAGKHCQAGFDVWGKRRDTDVEAQLDGRRHLVHVLPAGPGRAHEPLVDLALVERNGAGDLNQGFSTYPGVYQPVSGPH